MSSPWVDSNETRKTTTTSDTYIVVDSGLMLSLSSSSSSLGASMVTVPAADEDLVCRRPTDRPTDLQIMHHPLANTTRPRPSPPPPAAPARLPAVAAARSVCVCVHRLRLSRDAGLSVDV
mmetsp:Transcript_8661/g.22086  ORF Transcript_8661/g.22086 Transcript_8661/m.22086 type:complete len:120 (-) Transcript_8661:101-460(-)